MKLTAAIFLGVAVFVIGPVAIGLMPFMVGFMWSIKEVRA